MSALLKIDGLTRRFGGLVAVRDVAMEVASGAVQGLIGPNGAGKTTLLNLISGHILSSSGRIGFAGSEITRWSVDRRARTGIRRTFQNLKLFRDMTALENVMVGMHGETHCEIWHALLRTRSKQARKQPLPSAPARRSTSSVCLIWPTRGQMSYPTARNGLSKLHGRPWRGRSYCCLMSRQQA